jgi:hypothetical protein
MRRPRSLLIALVIASKVQLSLFCANATQPLGLFEGHTDVGTIVHPGTVN